MGFPTGCLGESFKVFIPAPYSARVGTFGFKEPSLLLAKKAFGFSCDPRLVDFTGCGFCGDIVFHNCIEVFFWIQFHSLSGWVVTLWEFRKRVAKFFESFLSWSRSTLFQSWMVCLVGFFLFRLNELSIWTAS